MVVGMLTTVLYFGIFILPALEVRATIFTGKWVLNNITSVANSINLAEQHNHFQQVYTVMSDINSVVASSELNEEINNSSQCLPDLRVYGQGLLQRQLWALKMLDSSTKIPDGILDGYIFYMGNFDECVNVDVPGGIFSGQHCLAMISKYSNSTEVNPVKESIMSMHWSTCIPSSCSPEDWQTVLQTAFVKYNNSIQITVGENSCQTKHSSDQLYTGDWIFIVVAIHLAVLVILSTGYDILQKDSDSRKSLYLSFSLYTNGKKLLTTSPSEESLHCLHGVRFLTMAWIVLDHQYLMYVANSPLVNMADIADVFSEWYRMYLLNGTLSVDTFFLMSGLLISYIFFTRMKDKSLSSFNVLLFYLHRYIRLTPLLAMLLFLQVTLFRVLGSGPLWSAGYEAVTEPCRKYWWSTLLYIQNYVNPNEICLGHTWYLCVDTQLYLLSPLVLILLWKKPKAGIIILSVFVAGGVILDFILAYVYEFSPNLVNGGVLNQQKDFYYPTHTRFPPWIIGIILGYIINSNKGKTLELKKMEVVCGWLVAATLTLGSLYIAYPMMQQNYTYNAWQCSSYLSVFRTTWSIGIAWIIYACVSGYGGAANTLLSWNAWQPLSRLTYGIYLIHIFVLLYEGFTTKAPNYFSDSNVVIYFFGTLCISTFLAAVLSLVLEYPFVAVEKFLMDKYSARRQTNNDLQGEEAGLLNETSEENNASETRNIAF